MGRAGLVILTCGRWRSWLCYIEEGQQTTADTNANEVQNFVINCYSCWVNVCVIKFVPVFIGFGPNCGM